MSEMTATFTFTAPADQSEYWQILLHGMANEELGAYMEERVEPFGEAAERSLEHFLDEYEDFHLSYYGYKHQVKKRRSPFCHHHAGRRLRNLMSERFYRPAHSLRCGEYQ